MDSAYSFGAGHDWKYFSQPAEGVRVYVCKICKLSSNDNPPYQCQGAEAGDKMEWERFFEKFPGTRKLFQEWEALQAKRRRESK